ncbi:MAG: PQQ-binding-like beta-propeller repeat protein [Halobacteria archaeon]
MTFKKRLLIVTAVALLGLTAGSGMVTAQDDNQKEEVKLFSASKANTENLEKQGIGKWSLPVKENVLWNGSSKIKIRAQSQDGDYLYGFSDGKIHKIDTETGEVAWAKEFDNANDVTVGPKNRYLYLNNPNHGPYGNIVKITPDGNQVWDADSSVIKTGSSGDLQISKDGKTVYSPVANTRQPPKLYALSAKTGEKKWGIKYTSQDITQASGKLSTSLSSDGNYIYVGKPNKGISKIDLSERKVVKNYSQPSNFVLSSNDRYLYSQGSQHLRKVDVENGEVEYKVTIYTTYGDYSVTQTDDYLFLTKNSRNGDNQFMKVNKKTGEVARKLDYGNGITSSAVDPKSNDIYFGLNKDIGKGSEIVKDKIPIQVYQGNGTYTSKIYQGKPDEYTNLSISYKLQNTTTGQNHVKVTIAVSDQYFDADDIDGNSAVKTKTYSLDPGNYLQNGTIVELKNFDTTKQYTRVRFELSSNDTLSSPRAGNLALKGIQGEPRNYEVSHATSIISPGSYKIKSGSWSSGISASKYGIAIFSNNVTLDGQGNTLSSSGVAPMYFALTIYSPRDEQIKNVEVKNVVFGRSVVGTLAHGKNINIHDNSYRGLGLTGGGNLVSLLVENDVDVSSNDINYVAAGVVTLPPYSGKINNNTISSTLTPDKVSSIDASGDLRLTSKQSPVDEKARNRVKEAFNSTPPGALNESALELKRWNRSLSDLIPQWLHGIGVASIGVFGPHIEITNNTVNNNYVGVLTGSAMKKMVIEHNNFKNNSVAMGVLKITNLVGSVKVHHNNFKNSYSYGLYNYGCLNISLVPACPGTVNAKNNWWQGKPSGGIKQTEGGLFNTHTYIANGSGEKLKGSIKFHPWLKKAETNQVNVSATGQQWQRIEFSFSPKKPVVFTKNRSELRLRSVNKDGFQIKKTSGGSDKVNASDVRYGAINEGVHRIAGVGRFEAGTVSLGNQDVKVNLSNLTNPDAVAVQTQSESPGDYLPRVKDRDQDGFTVSPPSDSGVSRNLSVGYVAYKRP